ncbi:Flagellar brake protein YcgR [Planctomycetes bacterium Pan216]|uniref:Flagellar brake protein YcgR n=1 Tax=Kolteria novifilia TaxID=2527975 RepID=A0A518BCZ0_9BACT|nr:Flagellar brake protein YcgR [Planctomycetes bacterium Pan216]
MPLWKKSGSQNKARVRVQRQLNEMAEANVRLGLHLRIDEGKFVPIGESRLLEIDADARMLIINMPSRDGHTLPLTVPCQMIAFANWNESYFKFETQAKRVERISAGAGAMLPVLMVTLPEQLLSANRRRHFRIEPLLKQRPLVEWQPTWMPHTSPTFLSAEVSDISARGISIWLAEHLGERFEPGRRAALRITLPNKSEVIETNATTRQVHHGCRGNETLVGLEFDLESSDPDEGIDAIAKYVMDCQREIVRQRQSL